MSFKKLLLAGAALLALGGVAASQINTVPQVGVNTANLRANTYTASIRSLVPVASSIDFFCISGSATKNIHVRRWELSGTAGTLLTTQIILLHRVSLDTGTVAVAATYGPVAASLRSTNPAATATLAAYNSTGGIATATDAAPTYIRNAMVTLPLSGTSTTPTAPLVWNFGTAVDAYDQGLDIPSGKTTEQYCLTLNGVSVSSGVLAGSIEWTED